MFSHSCSKKHINSRVVIKAKDICNLSMFHSQISYSMAYIIRFLFFCQ